MRVRIRSRQPISCTLWLRRSRAQPKTGVRLNVRSLRKCESVFYIYAKVSESVLDIAMTKQDLNRAQIARSFVDE